MESDYFAEFPPEMTHMTSYPVGYGPPRCDSQSRRWKTSCLSGIQDVRKGRKIIIGCCAIKSTSTSGDPTYPVLKTHQVKYWNSWCNQKKAGHLIRFCKKSLFAWSRLLRSLIDVLRLDVILHFNRSFQNQNIEQSSPRSILRPTSEYSCCGTNCSHYTLVTTTTDFSLKLCSFMFCSQ